MDNQNSPIQALINSVYENHKNLKDGAVADYIPELGFADADWFGIVVATVDGHIYSVGDVDQTFTIQSMSKAFTYALALQERGLDHVLSKVGVEPSGDAFNAISLDENGRPANPMINAGAIATTSLIQAGEDQTAIEKIVATYSAFAGSSLTIDEKVYQSESRTGHRNRAIGFMLRNFDIIEVDPLPILEDYFQQCSVLINCKDLAIMGATLANRGINPVTGEHIIDNQYIKNVLSAMGSCGMYDYSGNWLYHVGLPAKSGVGGGILTVLPGQMSIAVFSPPLDEKGNSCRGIAAVTELSKRLSLHVFNTGDVSASVIRACLNLTEISSNGIRNKKEKSTLQAHGQSALIYQLRGYFSFVACEKVIRHILESIIDESRYIMVNLSRVFGVSSDELDFLQTLSKTLSKQNIQLIYCDESLDQTVANYFNQDGDTSHVLFSQQDDMLSWVESHIIAEQLGQDAIDNTYPLESFTLCNNLSEENLKELASLLETVSYKEGQHIITHGESADALYFLTQGFVDVKISVDGKPTKISSISKGNLIGEMAILDGKPRSADIVAASGQVMCYRLSLEKYEMLSENNLELKLSLVKNIAAEMADKLRNTSAMLYAQAR